MIRKPIKKNPRASDAYKEFTRLVRKRDGNKCQMPGCNSRTKLQVHHIVRYADSTHLRLCPENSICLCRDCHSKVQNRETDYASLFIKIVGENIAKQKQKNKK